MSWRRFSRRSSEDVRLRPAYSSWSRRLLKTKTKNVFKTFSSRRMFAGYIWCIIWINYTFNVLLELVSLFLKNYKIDFDLSELKWIVASLMFIRFFVCTFFLKSLNFRLVDTLSAQFHSHMDYLIYWRYANSTHLRYSSFARNFEFSSLVICILRSTKSQNFTILLFSNFI